MWEAMKDQTPDGKGPNISAKFYIAFAPNRTSAYEKMHYRHVKTQNPM